MKRIFFSGLKGGVGNTTILANLASALVQAGESVTCIDLDSKNELRLHFAHQWDDFSGWSTQEKQTLDQVAFADEDGVKFIPHGYKPSTLKEKIQLISDSRNIVFNDNEWLLFDVPNYANAESLYLKQDDFFLRIINCDVNCHSLISQKTLMQQNSDEHFLINRFNSAVDIEVEIARLWRKQLANILPVFIHQDEILKEALAYKNVGYNCAPFSVIKDDFHALISWLKLHYSKATS